MMMIKLCVPRGDKYSSVLSASEEGLWGVSCQVPGRRFKFSCLNSDLVVATLLWVRTFSPVRLPAQVHIVTITSIKNSPGLEQGSSLFRPHSWKWTFTLNTKEDNPHALWAETRWITETLASSLVRCVCYVGIIVPVREECNSWELLSLGLLTDFHTNLRSLQKWQLRLKKFFSSPGCHKWPWFFGGDFPEKSHGNHTDSHGNHWEGCGVNCVPPESICWSPWSLFGNRVRAGVISCDEVTWGR